MAGREVGAGGAILGPPPRPPKPPTSHERDLQGKEPRLQELEEKIAAKLAEKREAVEACERNPPRLPDAPS